MIKVIVFLYLATAAYLWDTHCNEKYIIDVAEKKALQYNAKSDFAVVIDYNKSILSKRLFLVDLKSRKIILKSRVSHAKRSGLLFATDYSNKIGSSKSSPGAYITLNTYKGKAGYSMRLSGKESNVNDNVKKRNIVFHSVNPLYPWSEGCFATPSRTNRYLISKISNGRLVYVLN